MTVLLALREPLHRWVDSLSWQEIRAVLTLLAMSFLLLPLLPNRLIDPWKTINPYRVWLFAIMIAANFIRRLRGGESIWKSARGLHGGRRGGHRPQPLRSGEASSRASVIVRIVERRYSGRGRRHDAACGSHCSGAQRCAAHIAFTRT
jgi:hypothetical protein